MRESTQQLAQQPPHLSFSALNTLTSCGERYRLERGLRLSGPPSWAMVGGSAVHSASEEIDHEFGNSHVWDLATLFESHLEKAVVNQEERGDYTRDEFKSTGRASKDWPNKENRDWWMHHGPLFVQNWVTWREASPWDLFTHNGTPGIELAINITLGGKPNVMYVDRLFVLPSGELIVVDLKTGARKPPPFQLGQYKVGIEEALDVPVAWGAYWNARTNSTSPAEDLSRFDREWLDELYWRGNEIITQGLFIGNSDMQCDWCSVNRYCRYFGGADWKLARGVSMEAL